MTSSSLLSSCWCTPTASEYIRKAKTSQDNNKNYNSSNNSNNKLPKEWPQAPASSSDERHCLESDQRSSDTSNQRACQSHAARWKTSWWHQLATSRMRQAHGVGRHSSRHAKSHIDQTDSKACSAANKAAVNKIVKYGVWFLTEIFKTKAVNVFWDTVYLSRASWAFTVSDKQSLLVILHAVLFLTLARDVRAVFWLYYIMLYVILLLTFHLMIMTRTLITITNISQLK